MPEIVANSDVSEDRSVNTVEQANPVNPVDPVDAEMEREQREFEAEFGHIEAGPDEFDEEDESEFRLFPADKDDVINDDDAMIDDI